METFHSRQDAYFEATPCFALRAGPRSTIYFQPQTTRIAGESAGGCWIQGRAVGRRHACGLPCTLLRCMVVHVPCAAWPASHPALQWWFLVACALD